MKYIIILCVVVAVCMIIFPFIIGLLKGRKQAKEMLACNKTLEEERQGQSRAVDKRRQKRLSRYYAALCKEKYKIVKDRYRKIYHCSCGWYEGDGIVLKYSIIRNGFVKGHFFQDGVCPDCGSPIKYSSGRYILKKVKLYSMDSEWLYKIDGVEIK